MTVELLSLHDEERISALCRQLGLPLSEYNFANLYLFRKVHHYHLIEEQNSLLFLKGISYEERPFLMPLFHPKQWSDCLQIARKHQADYLFPIPEEWFPEVHAQGYSLQCSEDESDYLYDAGAIRSLHGRHLDGHRNLLRGFLSDHTVDVLDLHHHSLPKARTIIDQWAQAKQHVRDDVEACYEGSEQADLLGLQGWIYEVDGLPSGFLLGGPLTQHIYAYHFSKTSGAYRGLPTYMHHDVARRIPSQYTLLNWEQDLGIEGLRHAKRSYHPKAMVKKGRLWV